MRPPEAPGHALPAAWPEPAARDRSRPGLRVPGRRAKLTVVAALILATVVLAAVHVTSGSTPAAGTHPGTAFLQKATCASWSKAGPAQRMAIVTSLAAAATQPDPENRGATLSVGATYILFERACSTAVGQSALLYELYNRAASFRAVSAAGI